MTIEKFRSLRRKASAYKDNRAKFVEIAVFCERRMVEITSSYRKDSLVEAAEDLAEYKAYATILRMLYRESRVPGA